MLEAAIAGRQFEIAAQLFVHRTRYQDIPWRGILLQPGRQVDARAVDVTLLLDDVAGMQAHAKGDLHVVRPAGLTQAHLLLNIGGGLDGAVDALEASEKPISGVLHDPPRAPLDGWPDNLGEQRHQARMGRALIGIHQTRIASDVGKQDRGNLASHLRPR